MNSIVKGYYDTHKQQGTQWIHVARELYATQFLIKSIERKEKELKEQLQSLSGNVNSIGGGYTYTITSKKGSIDYSAIPVLKELDLEPYRKPKTYSWSLRRV